MQSTKTNLEQALKIMSQCADVQREVEKNFENNLWWPNTVSDKKMRLIIAGLSTRVSYNMISIYVTVIKKIENYTFNDFVNLDDTEKKKILMPLGLTNTRLAYVNSMIDFINNTPYINQLSDNEFITLVSSKVKGASYKVAQCALLYWKGYPNDIMPVDSGMKDVLLPCLGYPNQGSGIGHEKARRLLEKDINSIDKIKFISEQQLNIGIGEFNWWAHLTLIYYKRMYCNKKKKTICELSHNGVNIKGICTNQKLEVKN